MGKTQRNYEKEYKEQAVKPAKEIGTDKAAKELCVPKGTLSGWLKAVREGTGPGPHTPESAMSLAEEMAGLRKCGETAMESAWMMVKHTLRPNGIHMYCSLGGASPIEDGI